MTFRKLTDTEHVCIRFMLGADRAVLRSDFGPAAVAALEKLVCNYQDTALELAEHDAALEARIATRQDRARTESEQPVCGPCGASVWACQGTCL